MAFDAKRLEAYLATNLPGFAGPLTVRAMSLPAGVTASDVVLGGGESSGTITLIASAASAIGATSSVSVQLVEGSKVDDEAAGHSPVETVRTTGWWRMAIMT